MPDFKDILTLLTTSDDVEDVIDTYKNDPPAVRLEVAQLAYILANSDMESEFNPRSLRTIMAAMVSSLRHDRQELAELSFYLMSRNENPDAVFAAACDVMARLAVGRVRSLRPPDLDQQLTLDNTTLNPEGRQTYVADAVKIIIQEMRGEAHRLAEPGTYERPVLSGITVQRVPVL